MATIKLRQKTGTLSTGATNKAAPLTLAEMDDNLDALNADILTRISGTTNIGTQNNIPKYGATGLTSSIMNASATTVEITGTTAGNIQASLTTGQDSNFHLYAVNGNATTNETGTEVARFGVGYSGNVTTNFSAGLSFIRGGGAADGELRVITNATLAARINSSQDVGIGLAAADTIGARLHVKKSTGSMILIESSDAYNANLRLKNTVSDYSITPTGAGTGDFLMYDNTNSQSFYTYKKTTGHKWFIENTSKMVLDASGNLGVGATPVTKLQVIDSASITNTSGTQYLLMGNQDSSGANKPCIISAANGALGFGYGTSWTSATGGTMTTSLFVGGNGNVGVGYSATNPPIYKLQVNGSFGATTKSFVIDHPTKPGKQLRYGSLEGPENGVYIRGKCQSNVIELPEYWTKLVDQDSITVNLTPIGKHQKLYVQEIRDNKVFISNDGMFASQVNCFFTVYGERIDVEKLVVEI